jgi:tetratricopeptide (TPR) repeat protein
MSMDREQTAGADEDATALLAEMEAARRPLDAADPVSRRAHLNNCMEGAAAAELLDDRPGQIAAYERASQINPGDASIWDMLGRLHGEDGQHGAAQLAFQKALQVAADPTEEGLALQGLGLIALSTNHLDSSIDYLQHALPLLLAAEDQAAAATRCAKCIGSIKRQRDEPDAEAALQRAFALARSHQLPEEELACLNELVKLAMSRRQSDEWERLLGPVLELEIRLGRKKDQARTHRVLGQFARQRNDVANWRHHVEHALRLSEDIDDEEGESLALYQLGIIARDQNQADRAYELFTRSLDIAEELEAKEHMIEVLTILGDLEYRCDKLDEAEDWLERALTFSIETDNLSGQAGALYTLGCVAEDRGDGREKIACWVRAAECARGSGDQRWAEHLSQLVRKG